VDRVGVRVAGTVERTGLGAVHVAHTAGPAVHTVGHVALVGEQVCGGKEQNECSSFPQGYSLLKQ
jgi:hypothetical protein